MVTFVYIYFMDTLNRTDKHIYGHDYEFVILLCFGL